MKVTTTVSVPVADTFRLQQVAGMFDLSVTGNSSETFEVELPGLDEAWSVGAIVGPSGSGKSTVASKAFGNALVGGMDWPADKALLEGFAEKEDVRSITGMLNAVGFSSPPAWVRPYRVLSNGQRFRCDLARSLLVDQELVVYDEFTSVVDRTVAKAASSCVSKAVRSGRTRCKRFVAVTCHYDVLEWLQPDWWLDMGTEKPTAARGSFRRPPIRIEVRRVGREIWAMYRKHHYLSGGLHVGARCYEATWDGVPVGFCATLNSMGHAQARRVHRIVVLPDYQGLGIGMALLGRVAAVDSVKARVSITTSHVGLIRGLARSSQWKLGEQTGGTSRQNGMVRRGSFGRNVLSFSYLV